MRLSRFVSIFLFLCLLIPGCLGEEDEPSDYSDEDDDGFYKWYEEDCGSNPESASSIPKDNDEDNVCDQLDPDDDNDNWCDGDSSYWPYYLGWELEDAITEDGNYSNWTEAREDPVCTVLSGGDKFPFDSNEWEDTDGDGIGDNFDQFVDAPLWIYMLGFCGGFFLLICMGTIPYHRVADWSNVELQQHFGEVDDSYQDMGYVIRNQRVLSLFSLAIVVGMVTLGWVNIFGKAPSKIHADLVTLGTILAWILFIPLTINFVRKEGLQARDDLRKIEEQKMFEEVLNQKRIEREEKKRIEEREVRHRRNKMEEIYSTLAKTVHPEFLNCVKQLDLSFDDETKENILRCWKAMGSPKNRSKWHNQWDREAVNQLKKITNENLSIEEIEKIIEGIKDKQKEIEENYAEIGYAVTDEIVSMQDARGFIGAYPNFNEIQENHNELILAICEGNISVNDALDLLDKYDDIPELIRRHIVNGEDIEVILVDLDKMQY